MNRKKPEKQKGYDVTYKQLFHRLPKLWRFMRTYRKHIIVLLTLNLIRLLLISIPPLVTTYIIDEVIPKKDLFSVNILVGLVALLFITAAVIRMTNIYIRAYLGAHITYDIRKALYNALLNQSPEFYSKRASGEVTSRLNNDVRAVQFLASQALFDLTGTFLQIFISLGFLFYLSRKVTIVILCLTIVMYICVTINMNFHKRLRKRISERWGKLLGFLQEVISNIKRELEMADKKTAAEQLDDLVFEEMQENKSMNFSEAFASVQTKHPQLTRQYSVELGFSEPETTAGKPSVKLDKLVKEKMEKHPDLTYSVAFAEVQKENKALALEYFEEISR